MVSQSCEALSVPVVPPDHWNPEQWGQNTWRYALLLDSNVLFLPVFFFNLKLLLVYLHNN